MKINWDAVGKEPVKIANIMATRNYKMFRLLEGNRNLDHVPKLIKSINAVGILFQPILVNEKFENHRGSAQVSRIEIS